ncbi:hypothetical protein AUJ66_08160 [Candidatus Desantisbacteria bacterium CG1_02_38_46]|uniref:Urease accessory protein UreH-like transmembrane domain-containing protein n=3 Tax=unclassified Candidatus Desantisiibacteriota TaxID=3106372 RepID=A0A2H9PE90_9BACT|nr:MAG: hypothetical protein AUJ66_08160 [Candidatus Desantisbacteria bacterium CG1_02_38_46]PIU51471.1 MAG: hypothetical protein COS91_04310 [Candidatus Desantisbacteria bacterium CG07_land_8_20_14_0_80_39_15]PIZ17063.1 MAG: hypothetical protein COY51_01225 [Candidatus Desantisbacteria bacterium CG_4_10_14_0_8_um_filter_39_17]
MAIWKDLSYAFILGFSVGVGPCLILCAPIVISYVVGTKSGWKEGFFATLVFSVWRTIPYLILGYLAGMAGQNLIPALEAGKFYKPIQIAVGIFIIFLSVLIMLGKAYEIPVCKLLGRQFIDRGDRGFIPLGFMIGFLPCAPLIGLLSYIAFMVKNSILGLLYALFFGIGTTLPLLFLGALAGFLPGLLKTHPRDYLLLFPTL